MHKKIKAYSELTFTIIRKLTMLNNILKKINPRLIFKDMLPPILNFWINASQAIRINIWTRVLINGENISNVSISDSAKSIINKFNQYKY